MAKFCLKILGFAPILAMVMLLNFRVDPANIYKKGYESKAADILLHGQNVVGMLNYDERIFQEEIVKKREKCPDTILLGSSRVMTLSNDVVEMKDYWNHGVSGAGIYDYLGILGMYNKSGQMPKQVILGVDPWILNEKNGDTRYQSIIQYVDSFRETMEGDKSKVQLKFPFFEKELQIFSLSYFQSSVDLIRKEPELLKGPDFDFYGTTEKEAKEMIRYIDGSIEYGESVRNKPVEEVDKEAWQYVSGSVYQIEDYQELDPNMCLMFENMIDYLQEKEVCVIFYLPPYHPIVYEYIEGDKNYEMVLRAEEYFKNLAIGKGIQVYGSYNPEVLQCTGEDFLDGMHMRRSCMSKCWVKNQED